MRRALCLGLIAVLAAPEVSAQTAVEEAYPDKYPPALPMRKGPPPPRFVFDLLGETELPGPLPDGTLELVDGRLRIAVAGGTAWAPPLAEAVPEIAAGEPAAASSEGTKVKEVEWILAPDGEMRFRVDVHGRVLAQNRSSRGRWHKEWMIRTPRAAAASPLIVGPRLFYTGVDDRIYAVRASNGHRLWAVDVGEPVSRPLVRWHCAIPVVDPVLGRVLPVSLDALLVVPDGGGSLQAFDLYDGTAVGSFRLPAVQGWLTSSPVIVDENHLVVARQGYVPEQAALVFLGLLAPAPASSPETPTAAETPTGPETPAEETVRQPPL